MCDDLDDYGPTQTHPLVATLHINVKCRRRTEPWLRQACLPRASIHNGRNNGVLQNRHGFACSAPKDLNSPLHNEHRILRRQSSCCCGLWFVLVGRTTCCCTNAAVSRMAPAANTTTLRSVRRAVPEMRGGIPRCQLCEIKTEYSGQPSAKNSADYCMPIRHKRPILAEKTM